LTYSVETPYTANRKISYQQKYKKSYISITYREAIENFFSGIPTQPNKETLLNQTKTLFSKTPYCELIRLRQEYGEIGKK